MRYMTMLLAAALAASAVLTSAGPAAAQDTCPIWYSAQYGTCDGHDTGTPPPASDAPPRLTTVAVVGQHWNCAVNGEATIVTTSELNRCDDPDSFTAYNYPDGHTVRHEDDEGRFSHYTQEYHQPLYTIDPIPAGTGPDRTHSGTSVIGVGDTPPPSEGPYCPIFQSMQNGSGDGTGSC